MKIRMTGMLLAAGLLASSAASAANVAETAPVAPDVTSWHGFNLLGLFRWTESTNPQDREDRRSRGYFPEEQFKWISDWGFNFVRLPMDYRNFLVATNDWHTFKEETFLKVDDAVNYGRKYGIHVQICLHRAPGFTCVGWDPEPTNLATDAEPQRLFFAIWKEFARRYRGRPNREVSFNPLNEPGKKAFTEEQFNQVFGDCIKAIREVDPNRFVMLDGQWTASKPAWAFKDVPLTGQAFRGYVPHAISHYGAFYVTQPPSEPTWPIDPKMLAEGRKKQSWIFTLPEEALETFRPLAETGYPVMIGEFGCRAIRHETCLKWMEHCLKLWQKHNLGWALWNLDGSNGVLDSGRKDVAYEKFHEHLLDRKMLELLQKYARLPNADRLEAPRDGNTRLEGRVGAAVERCINARVYSDWARGPMYAEAANAFRTHADDEGQNAGWQNEYWGKTMLCTAGAIAYTHDTGLAKRVLAKTHAFLDEFQRPNGYLSTYAKEDFLGGAQEGRGKWCFNIWGRKYTFWALVELHRVTGDRRCLEAAKKMADHLMAQLARLKRTIESTGSWYGISSMSILRPMNELYRLTGDRRYLDFSKQIVAALVRPDGGQGAILANAARPEEIRSWFPEPAYWAKTYETLSCIEGAVDSLRLDDNAAVRTGVSQYVGHLLKEELNPIRSVGCFDHFFGGGSTFNANTELCDVTHWIRVCRELLLLTGEARYADYMEEAFFNAFLAGVSRDGRWGAHVIRCHGTRHLWAPPQTGMTEHQCCPDNMMRTYFDMANTMAARDADGTLALLQYADFTTRFSDATVSVHGGYPYGEGAVTVSVTREKAGKTRFRVPAWSTGAFTVNGARAQVEKGWCAVESPAGASSYELRFDWRPRICDLDLASEPGDNHKPYGDNRYQFVRHNMQMLTPEMNGLLRQEAASFVMRGPLVLAKARLSGMSREDTFHATSLRGQYPKAGSGPHAWNVSIARLGGTAATAGAEDVWRLTFTRGGREKVEATVTDFASASNVDDPSNWFSIWF